MGWPAALAGSTGAVSSSDGSVRPRRSGRYNFFGAFRRRAGGLGLWLSVSADRLLSNDSCGFCLLATLPECDVAVLLSTPAPVAVRGFATPIFALGLDFLYTYAD